jgi:hypothetical protein
MSRSKKGNKNLAAKRRNQKIADTLWTRVPGGRVSQNVWPKDYSVRETSGGHPKKATK